MELILAFIVMLATLLFTAMTCAAESDVPPTMPTSPDTLITAPIKEVCALSVQEVLSGSACWTDTDLATAIQRFTERIVASKDPFIHYLENKNFSQASIELKQADHQSRYEKFQGLGALLHDGGAWRDFYTPSMQNTLAPIRADLESVYAQQEALFHQLLPLMGQYGRLCLQYLETARSEVVDLCRADSHALSPPLPPVPPLALASGSF